MDRLSRRISAIIATLFALAFAGIMFYLALDIVAAHEGWWHANPVSATISRGMDWTAMTVVNSIFAIIAFLAEQIISLLMQFGFSQVVAQLITVCIGLLLDVALVVWLLSWQFRRLRKRQQ